MPTDLPRADAAPRRADEPALDRAAYVHIPFCRRVCPYCDFAVIAGRDDLVDRYVSAVVREIRADAPFPEPLSAVYVGGGTPSTASPGALGRIVSALRERFGMTGDAEVSLEANPEDITPRLLDDLGAAGFTRVSLGVQSLDDEVLASLGRAHDGDAALRAVTAAVAAMPSVNADLMFGTPGESASSWARGVEEVLERGVDHLSTYALTVERGTELSRRVRDGAPAPDPDDQAEKYEVAVELCAAAGLVRYETSNHARRGRECVYNLITWSQGEYAAFGNGAHRHRAGVRSWNVRRVDRYIEAIEAGASAVSASETLDAWQREVERVLLGVRRSSGVEPGPAGAALLASEDGRRLVAAGVMAEREGRLVVTRPLLGDEVARSLLALEPRDC